MTDEDRNLAAFEAQKQMLAGSYRGQWLLFHDGSLVNAYATFEFGKVNAEGRFAAGSYLLKKLDAEP